MGDARLPHALCELRIENFRNLSAARIEPCTGLNIFIGENGAGKTSVLEALSVLGSGISFRTRKPAVLVSDGSQGFSLFGRWEQGSANQKIGLAWSQGKWRGRIDGQHEMDIKEFASRMPLSVFEPGSHNIVSGPPASRRRFLDSTVFHVEPRFSGTWRDYRRILVQRNALLKRRDRNSLPVWDVSLARAGEELDEIRRAGFLKWLPRFHELMHRLSDDLGELSVRFDSGWEASRGLATALASSLDDDIKHGYTRFGPHRSNLILTWRGRSAADALSRGQAKIVAMAMILAKAAVVAEVSSRRPLLLLDDVGSELDQKHLALLREVVSEYDQQLWSTGTEDPGWFDSWQGEKRLFHVERGLIRS